VSRAGPGARGARAAAACAALLLLAPLARAETFNYSGDSMSTELSSGSQHALLKGNARVDSGDMRITADEIELFGKDFIYAQCRGSVHVVDTKRGIDLKSDELFYDRQQKISRIKGNAVMADLKNEMVIKGGFIEDRDKEKLTIVQIGVRILKQDLVCRAEFARYWREKKILELSGMPWVTKKGDEYRSARMTVNIDTEDIILEGDVKGTIQQSEATDGDTAPSDGGTAPSQGEAGGR